MTKPPAISIRNLEKRYAAAGGAEGKLALGGVSIDVPQGEIFGLLGPNGAGKSTLINILAGLVMKTAGEVSIWGFDIDRDRFSPLGRFWRIRPGYMACRRRSGLPMNCWRRYICRTRRGPMRARFRAA